METNTMTEATKAQNVPAIRSDSVVAYLSNLAAVMTNIASDLNQQITSITASMNASKVDADTQTKETTTND